ncbi:MAG: hypothetical protein KatS3mg007_1384 [Thermoanaerobaculum sp.]|nr:MAG: hypothetical protein KatS3mg007_1384 [Thermoanaerobaculum sp.]
MSGFATPQELVRGIRQGMVSRAVRVFAAQGLLPVPREELLRILVFLASDSDQEIAEAARESLSSFTAEHARDTLALPDLDPLEIDLIAKWFRDEGLWQEIIRDPRTADETLRWLARVAPPTTQDALVTNQVRLLGCLEIIEDLRANPQVTPDILRRLREFEEEFLEKATVWASATDQEAPPEPVHGPSIGEALEELKAVGIVPPGPEVEPVKAPEPETGAPKEVQDAFVRIALMNTYQRIMQALKGTREERLILVRDRSSLVVRAVLASPKLSEGEVEQIAGMRAVNEEALRIIASRQRFLRRYGVVRNLVFNPRTPPAIAIQLMSRLSDRDLRLLARDRNVSEPVRRVARERVALRE